MVLGRRSGRVDQARGHLPEQAVQLPVRGRRHLRGRGRGRRVGGRPHGLPGARLDGGCAGGYGASKWAGEVLLRAAHDAYGLPVAVFRSNLILAHPRYRGS